MSNRAPKTRSSAASAAISRRAALGQLAGAGAALALTIRYQPASASPTSARRQVQKGALMQVATPSGDTPTVVLVHGAFADASGWAGVIAELQGDGITVMAPANPLRGLAPHAANNASVVSQIAAPVLLVGHSYGGVVITNASPQVTNAVGLVYVAAFAPDEGESVMALAGQATDSLLGPALRPADFPTGAAGEAGHELYIDQAAFHDVFCADLPAELAAAMAVSQRPGAEAGFGEPSGPAGWKTLPSWAVIATADKTIGLTGERFMAERAGAITVDVDASHVVMISQPRAVADLIRTALGTLA
jgi:pimeloyl-ACP methyl ester carboxylesterase